MASLRPMRGKWYARISSGSGIGRKEILIPLRSESKVTARQRLSKVESAEADIKSGVITDVKAFFKWLNKDHTSTIVRMTLADAVEEYLHYQKIVVENKVKSIRRTREILNNLMKSVGATRPVESISDKHIIKFKESCRKRLSKTGVYIQMSRVNGFINWLYKYKRKELGLSLDNKPIVEVGKQPKKMPSYLSETEFAKIMKISWLSQFHKDVFTFYRATGCRLREPFYGNIEQHGDDGWWLVVSSDKSKTGVPRQIKLTYQQMCFVKDMVGRKNPNCTIEHHTNGSNKNGNFSKIFKKAVREIGKGDLKFHNLRDTFAVMRYLETRDIYQVSKELGHSSVKVTEKYLTHELTKIRPDFPSLDWDNRSRKQAKNGDVHTDYVHIESMQVESASR